MAIYRVTAFGHMVDGEEWNATWHINKVTGQAAVVSARAADAWTKMWSGTNSPVGNLEALYPASIGVDGVRCDELDDSGRNVSQVVTALALVGTSSDEALPASVAVAVSLRTDSPTKFGRGRFFLPSPVVTIMDSQKIASATVTTIKNAALAALNDMLDNACPVVIYHRNTTGFDQVVSVDVGDVPDVQNRRRNQTPETRVRSNLS